MQLLIVQIGARRYPGNLPGKGSQRTGGGAIQAVERAVDEGVYVTLSDQLNNYLKFKFPISQGIVGDISWRKNHEVLNHLPEKNFWLVQCVI